MNNLNNQNNKEATINPSDLNSLIKNAAEINEAIQPHLVLENKFNIWIRIANNIFPILRNFTFLFFSGWYFWKKMIGEDILSKMVNFALNNAYNHWSLLIICSTGICLYLIKNKYK